MKWAARNVISEPFAAALGFLALQTGLRGFVDSNSLPLHAVIGDLSYAWAGVYATGGAFLLYGIGILHTKYEAAGSYLFATGALVQAFVTAWFIGRSPFLSYWSVSTLASLGLAGIYRGRRLVKGERLMWVKPA